MKDLGSRDISCILVRKKCEMYSLARYRWGHCCKGAYAKEGQSKNVPCAITPASTFW